MSSLLVDIGKQSKGAINVNNTVAYDVVKCERVVISYELAVTRGRFSFCRTTLTASAMVSGARVATGVTDCTNKKVISIAINALNAIIV